MSTSERKSFSLSAQRSLRAGAFEQSEIDKFDILTRHAARAFSVSTLIEECEFRRTVVPKPAQSGGVILLDNKGFVLEADEAARELFGPVFKLSQGQLTAVASPDRPKLARAIGDTLLQSTPQSRTLALTFAGRLQPDVLVTVLPINSMLGAFGWLVLKARLILLVQDLQKLGAVNVTESSLALGLTAGQAKIAVRVGLGTP